MKWLLAQRHWVGATMIAGGGGMALVHYMDYGYAAHLTMPDHGITGGILVLLGILLAAGKPGQKRRR